MRGSDHKPAIHRGEEAAAARRRLEQWARSRNDVRVMTGKDIIELSVAGVTKGSFVEDLLADYDGVVFIGDDTTDETVFEILRPTDIGIKVGEGQTAALFRVSDVTAVVDALGVMASSISARP